jgi:hypothetical protein
VRIGGRHALLLFPPVSLSSARRKLRARASVRARAAFSSRDEHGRATERAIASKTEPGRPAGPGRRSATPLGFWSRPRRQANKSRTWPAPPALSPSADPQSSGFHSRRQRGVAVGFPYVRLRTSSVSHPHWRRLSIRGSKVALARVDRVC